MKMAEPRLVGPFLRDMVRWSPRVDEIPWAHLSSLSRSESGSTLEPQSSCRQSPDRFHAWTSAARSWWSRLLSFKLNCLKCQ